LRPLTLGEPEPIEQVRVRSPSWAVIEVELSAVIAPERAALVELPFDAF